MTTTFQSLKKSRSNFTKLNEELQKLDKNKFEADERYWKPELDKAGNANATIRFLPPPKNEEVSWVRLWSHGFKGPTGLWYIENSLTTINKNDPISESNGVLWNTGTEENKALARKRKRQLRYISNILVVKDPSNPENEGKVFLFSYGMKIFEMIKNKLTPEFDDQEAVNIFDFWEGANYRLRIKKVAGYSNYDSSEFDTQTAIFEDDKAIEEIWNKEFGLQNEISEDKFKTYDVLKSKFLRVVAGEPAATDTSDSVTGKTVNDEKQNDEKDVEEATKNLEEVTDDSEVDYFAKLAEES